MVHNADSGRKPRIPHSGDPAGYGKRGLMRCQLRSRLKIERCPRQIAVDCKSLSRHSPVVRLTHAPAPGLQSTAIMGPQPHLAGTAKIAIDCNRLQSDNLIVSLQSTANGRGPCCRTRRRRSAVRYRPETSVCDVRGCLKTRLTTKVKSEPKVCRNARNPLRTGAGKSSRV